MAYPTPARLGNRGIDGTPAFCLGSTSIATESKREAPKCPATKVMGKPRRKHLDLLTHSKLRTHGLAETPLSNPRAVSRNSFLTIARSALSCSWASTENRSRGHTRAPTDKNRKQCGGCKPRLERQGALSSPWCWGCCYNQRQTPNRSNGVGRQGVQMHHASQRRMHNRQPWPSKVAKGDRQHQTHMATSDTASSSPTRLAWTPWLQGPNRLWSACMRSELPCNATAHATRMLVPSPLDRHRRRGEAIPS